MIGEPLVDKEGIVYGEIDLNRCIQPRQMHDITGHYNRFDIFDLQVNRRPLTAARFNHQGQDIDELNVFPSSEEPLGG